MKKTFAMKRPATAAAKPSTKPKKEAPKAVVDDEDIYDIEEEEDEAEQVKPSKSVAKKAPAKKPVEDEDEDDVDIEEEEPVTKKKAPPAKSTRRKVEEDEDEVDIEEDEEPVAKKRRAVDSDGVVSEKRDGRRKKFSLNNVPGYAENKNWTDKLQILTREDIIKATSSRSKGIMVRLFAPTDRGEEATIVSYVWPNFEKSDGKTSGRKFTFHPDDCNDACYPLDDNELYSLCKEYGYNVSQEMFIPVIIRDKQEELGELPAPSKNEAKTGYQDLDDPTPSPVYMLCISKKVFNDKIKSQVVQVRTSGKRGSSSESFPLWDAVHGKDILLTCTYDKQKPPTDRYEFSVSPQEKAPLTEEEEQYLIPDVMGALDEALSEEDRLYIPSQFLKDNIVQNKFAKDDKKKPSSKSNNRRKYDDDEEDMYENTSSRKRAAKKPKDEDDEDDDGGSYADDDDEDEDDEPPKKRTAAKKPAATKRRPSRQVDEDEDDGDDDLPF